MTAKRLWYLLQCALHLLARLVAALGSLARDACESVYAASGLEAAGEAEEAFAEALRESRLGDEEQEPWTMGRW